MEDTQLRRLPPDGHEFPPSYTEHIPPPPEPVTEVEKPPPPLPASDPPTMIKPPVPLPASDPPTMIKPPVPLPASDPPTMIKPPVPLPASDPPTMIKPPVPLPASDPPTMIKPSVRVTSWRKDEKSECSVRDKIAMFSSASANLDRSSSTGGLFPTPEKSLNLDRSSNSFSQYSVDRSPSFLNNFPVPEKTSNFERSIGSISHFSVPEKSPNLDRSSNSVGHFSVSEKLSNLDLHSSPDKDSTDHSPSSLGMFSSSGNKPSNMERTHSSINVYTVSDPKTSLDRTHSSLDLSFTPGPNYSTLPRKPSTTSSTEGGPRLTRATSFSGPSSLHTRSQSLIDIGRGTMEDMRKASLNALIEQRRRGMSKLRGLVIPEKVSEVATPSPSICDLPEIRSRDSIFVKSSYSPTQTQRPNISATGRWSTGPCVFNTTSNTTTTTTTTNNTAPSIVMPSPPWKASNTNNLPKYSPAFKRKSLTVYGTSTTIKDEPPASLESITSPARSDLSFEYKDSMDDKNSTVGRHNSAEDDSDTDSAVSSSRSSISPPPTPPPPPLQSPLRRTLSSETTASGSSSTASTITCGSSDSNRRVLKAQSVEAINRKNVLSSARYSSGKDIKVGSPLIQRKFDEEERRVAYVTEVIDPEEEKPEPPKPLPAPRRTPMPPKPVQRKSMEVNPEEEADLLSVLMGGRIRRQRSKDNMLSDERRSASVHDIRKTFEAPGRKVNHARVSSLDSTASEDSFTPQYGSVGNLHREQFGSVTSIASSTSLISPQELQVLIDEANQPLDDCDVVVVILHREGSTGSIGITLAGGADYEAKEITVHKVLAGSPADRDGRIQKGDRILSINGRSMKGVTHRESLNILKAPRSEVVLVVSRSRGIQEPNNEDECTVAPQIPRTSRPPRIPEQPAEVITVPSGEERGPPVTVTLTKDGAGLGFSLEGGKESPLGDKPLTIKKIFTGGSAEKNGELCAGDELLNVNGTDVTLLSRIEAWGLMKRLPDGPVNLTVRHRLNK